MRALFDSVRVACRSAAVALAICALVACVAIGLSAATVLLDAGRLRNAIGKAFDSGELVTAGYLGQDARRGRYSVNDCLVLQTLVVAGGDWQNAGIRSRVLDAPAVSVCQALRDYVAGRLPAATPTYDYARYFFAAKAFVGPALLFSSIDGIRQFLRIAIYGLLSGVLLVSLARTLKPGSGSKLLPVTLLVVAAGWLTLYDLRYYAPLLAHGFSELVLIGYMAYCLYAPGSTRERIPRRIIWLGALTACFELLTGPALLAAGLAVLLDFASDPDRPHPLRRALRIWLATAASILATLLLLQVAVFVVDGGEAFKQFFGHLLLRMNLHLVFGLPMEANWQIAENLTNYSLKDVAVALVRNLRLLTFSSRAAANLVFVGSLLALTWAAVAGLRRREKRGVLVYAFVALSLFAWAAAFANHTVIHAWAMVRMTVLLPICAVMSLLYLHAGELLRSRR